MDAADRYPRCVDRPGTASLLVRACHPSPTVAVTVLALLLGVASGLGPARVVLLGAAVLAGQLVIGWSNDLLDADRDAAVGRSDKPIAGGQLSRRAVRVALALALVGCVVASFALGWRSGLVHLVLVVGSGWAYNLGLKARLVSFVPYAVAFGALPAVVQLSVAPPLPPPGWMVITGAALGVGAHLVNALPDLADDAATGVRGLPHRLGARGSRRLAALLLLGGAVVSVLGPATPAPWWVWLALVASAGLAVLIMIGRGRAPFRAAVAVAIVVVVVLVQRTLSAG